MRTLPHISKSRLSSYQRLTRKKFRSTDGKFIVEGLKSVSDGLIASAPIEAIMVTPKFQSKDEFISSILPLAKKSGLEVLEVSEDELGKISDTVTAQGVAGVVRIERVTLNSVIARLPTRFLFVALDGVADPGNLGTIIRTCDWFGVDGIFLSPSTVELHNPKVVRASMGSFFHLPIITDVDLIEHLRLLRSHGATILSTCIDGGESPGAISIPSQSVILFGNEAHGLSESLDSMADRKLTIPKFGKAESLNVSIACAIILHSLKVGN